MKANVG